MPTFMWSLDPLLHVTLPDEVFEGLYTELTFVQNAFLFTILFSLAYIFAHKLLQRYSKKYNEIECSSKRIVVLHHVIEALVLFVALPPFTYHMIVANFQVHQEKDAVLSSIRVILRLCYIFMVMYTMELASRYEDPRALVVFHHLLASFDGYLLGVFPTNTMFKTGSILVYFICFEHLLFVGLLMYRILPNHKATPNTILAGMFLFGISRPFQLLWVGAVIFGSWNDESVVRWQAMLQIVVTLILTLVQVWTLKIHYGIWKRCTCNMKGGDEATRKIDESFRPETFSDDFIDSDVAKC
jgi:hypothetical protein